MGLPQVPKAMAATPAIELRDVFLGFDENHVLKGVSLRVAPGETLFLLGVTGSGKTLLLRLMLGLLKPDAGGVLVEGRDLAALSETELHPIRKRMGIVFQEGALFDSLSVYENVAYRLREEGLEDEEEITRRVREALSFVEMEAAIEKMPAELSGGMRRRVSIARAIISNPAIMLYDSPTAGLDPVTAHAINLLIAKLRDVQGSTSVVVTHRLQDAYVLANFIFSPEKQDLVPMGTDGQPGKIPAVRFLVLREGQVYFEGSQQELVRARDEYLARFLA